MSLLESLAATLSDMGFAQLGLAFMVVVAYCLAINGSFSGTLRSGAASTAFVAGTAFATLTPSWVSGVVVLALVVVGLAAFAAAAWVLSALLGLLGSERAVEGAVDERFGARVAPSQAAHAMAPSAAIPL